MYLNIFQYIAIFSLLLILYSPHFLYAFDTFYIDYFPDIIVRKLDEN